MIPLPCAEHCHCFFMQHHKLNTMNCSSAKLSQLPKEVLLNAEWLNASNNNIDTLCETPLHFAKLKVLALRRNFIQNICDDFIHNIKESKLDYLDLSYNKLQRISQKFKETFKLKTVMLANNPFHCDCNILWMSEWMRNITTYPNRKY